MKHMFHCKKAGIAMIDKKNNKNYKTNKNEKNSLSKVSSSVFSMSTETAHDSVYFFAFYKADICQKN